jgi:hypothetical protein
VAAFQSESERFFALSNNCDKAVAMVKKISARDDASASYGAAMGAAEACHAVSGAVSAFTFTANIAAPRRAALDGIKAPCATAYDTRASQMWEAARLFDGDVSPQVIDREKRLGDQAKFQKAKCVSDMIPAADKAGFNGWSVLLRN